MSRAHHLRLVTPAAPDPFTIPTPPPGSRLPHVGDDAYNRHTGFYVGTVRAVHAESVDVAAHNGATHRGSYPAARLTFAEPIAAQIARLRATI